LQLLRCSNTESIRSDKTEQAPLPALENFFALMPAVTASNNLIGKDIFQT
jgi:hypothetical protein